MKFKYLYLIKMFKRELTWRALTMIPGDGKLEAKNIKADAWEDNLKLYGYGPISGYDVISFIHDKFHLLVSSGTVYSLLYSLERNGLIEGTWNERKRVYKLTEKGKKTIETILNANDKIQNFITALLKVQSTA